MTALCPVVMCFLHCASQKQHFQHTVWAVLKTSLKYCMWFFFLWFSCQSNYGCNHNDVTQMINYLSNPVSEPHSYHVSTFYVQSTLDLNKCFNTFGNMLIHSLASVVGLTLQLPRKVAKQIISTLGHTNNLGGLQSIDRAVLLKLLSVSNIMKK